MAYQNTTRCTTQNHKALQLNRKSDDLWRYRDIPVLHTLTPEQRYRRHRVIVVGAGAAGSYQALHLQRLGFEVMVLSRDEGRLRSTQLTAPGEINRGGMRLPMDTHAFVVQAIHEAGLETAVRPFRNDEPNAWLRLRGHQVRMRDYRSLAPLYDATSIGDPKTLMKTELDNALQALGGSHRAATIERTLIDGHPFGYMTVRDALRARDLTDDQCAYVALVCGVYAYLDTPLGELAVDHQSLYGNQHYATLAGGLGQLSRRMLERSAAPCVQNATVTDIEISDRGVVVHYHTADGQRTVAGDFVMLSVPTQAVTAIRFSPELETVQREAFEQVRYASSAKTLVVAQEPFWLREGIRGGMSWTDEAIQQVVYPTRSKPGQPTTFVASYTWEHAARRLMNAGTDAERFERVVAGLERLHPGVRASLRAYEHSDWDALAGYGAFTYYGPGDYARFHRHLSTPFPESEPRVFFAGEHAGLHHGWAEAALQSGQWAILQLLSTLRMKRMNR